MLKALLKESGHSSYGSSINPTWTLDFNIFNPIFVFIHGKWTSSPTRAETILLSERDVKEPSFLFTKTMLHSLVTPLSLTSSLLPASWDLCFSLKKKKKTNLTENQPGGLSLAQCRRHWCDSDPGGCAHFPASYLSPAQKSGGDSFRASVFQLEWKPHQN